MSDLRVPMSVVLQAFGVDITVTVPGGDPVEGRGAWLPDLIDEVPAGGAFTRRERRRVLAVDLAEFVAMPRGTIVQAPPRLADPVARFMVDAFERMDTDHARVVLIDAEEDLT